MSQQKIGREVADGAVNAKQQEVAALLKKKVVADGVVETAAADSVFASDASVMVAATGTTTGLFAGVSTGTLIAGGIGLVALGVLAAEAGDDDNDGGSSPSPSPAPGPGPSPTPSPTPGPGNSGNTGPNALVYTLTNQTDNLLGGSADEQFIGDAATATAGDTLNGGAGTDTVKLFGVAGVVPNISNIENAYYFATTANVDISTKGDVKNIELDNSGGKSVTIANGQSVTFSNTAGNPDIIGNTVTALNLTLNNVGAKASAGGDSKFDLKSTAETSVSIAVGGTGQSFATLLNTGAALNTINVAAKQAFDLQHALGTVTTIDASASTASVDIDSLTVNTSLTFTGGAGNDRIMHLGAGTDLLTGADKLTGGAGTDTLGLDNSKAAATNSLAATVAGVSGFEIIESINTTSNQVLDLAALNAKNTLSGLVLSGTTAGNGSNVSNLNAATANNISVLTDQTAVVLASNAFLSGGTTDTASINLDDSGGAFGNGDSGDAAGVVVAGLTFAQADVLNLKSTSDGTPIFADQNKVTGLVAIDLNKLVLSGDNALLVSMDKTSTELTEVDATGLVLSATAVAGGLGLDFASDAAPLTSLLVRGTARADEIDINGTGTNTTTVFTAGGSDFVNLTAAATGTNAFIFTATALTGGDIGGNQTIKVNTTDLGGTNAVAVLAAGQVVTIDFSATLEGLLKNNNINLGTTAANIGSGQFLTTGGAGTVPAISANSNIAAGYDTTTDIMTLQIDINGDGAFNAGDDWQMQFATAAGDGDTVVYNASSDVITFTVA